MKKKKNLFQNYPPLVRKKLLELRALIFEVAKDLESVGPIEESLRWGQPSYLTSVSKSGTTIRIDQYKGCFDQYAMYFHCHTKLVSCFKDMFGDDLTYEGQRAIIFSVKKSLPKKVIRQCIEMALTYHQR